MTHFISKLKHSALTRIFIDNLEVVEGEFDLREDRRHVYMSSIFSWIQIHVKINFELLEDFDDMTLSCDDDCIQAHKMIRI